MLRGLLAVRNACAQACWHVDESGNSAGMATTSGDQFNALLEMPPSAYRAAWRRGRATQWLGIGLAWGWLVFLVFLIQYGALLPVDAFPTDTETLVMIAFILAFPPLTTVLFTPIVAPPAARWFGARIVRNALLEGNETVAPVALEQPPALTPEQSADLAAMRLPLRFARVSRTAVIFTVSVLLITVGQITLVISTLHRMPATTYYDSLQALLGVFQLVYGVFFGEKIVTIYAGPEMVSYGWSAFLPMRRQRLIAVDDWGIRWQPRSWRRREQTLAWQDVVSFGLHRHKSGFSSGTAYTYMLLGNEAAFAWIVPARAKPVERSSSALLCQLAVARSGRPLRDVTASADVLSAWEAPISSKPKAYPNDREPRKSLLAALTALREGDGGPITRFDAESARPRLMRLPPRFYWLNALEIAVVILGLCGGWLFAHHQAESYLDTWPARVASETPLFSDPLTSNINGWPVHTPTSDNDGTNLAFMNGGYTVNGGLGTDYNAWYGARYADVAVAVTMRVQEASEYGADVGLVARVHEGYAGGAVDEIIFKVDPLVGAWSLIHIQPPRDSNDDGWRYLTLDNTSAAIHTGVGVPNRLMLVVVGAMYYAYAYANGQFLGSIYDPYALPPAPQSGYVGLWALATTATFNDFAIYPAPPPYQPLLHG